MINLIFSWLVACCIFASNTIQLKVGEKQYNLLHEIDSICFLFCFNGFVENAIIRY